METFKFWVTVLELKEISIDVQLLVEQLKQDNPLIKNTSKLLDIFEINPTKYINMQVETDQILEEDLEALVCNLFKPVQEALENAESNNF